MGIVIDARSLFPDVDNVAVRKRNVEAGQAIVRAKRRALVAFHSRSRDAKQKQRTPAWADMGAIRRVYEEAVRLEAATGIKHHVDHEIPLQGKLVSGLHVHLNLRAIPAAENMKKRNKFEV